MKIREAVDVFMRERRLKCLAQSTDYKKVLSFSYSCFLCFSPTHKAEKYTHTQENKTERGRPRCCLQNNAMEKNDNVDDDNNNHDGVQTLFTWVESSQN